MLILALAACTKPDTPTPTPPGDTAVPTPTASTADTGPFPWEPTQLDCPTLPPLPTTFTNLPIAAAEDFGFDAAGNLVAVDLLGNLQTQTIDGTAILIAPNLGSTRGARPLPDGSVVVAMAEQGVIEQIQPDGQRTTLASVPAPNGLAVDPWGSLWVTSSIGVLQRVQLDTAEVTTIVDVTPVSLDGITFSPDYRRLFFNSEGGQVGVIELDATGEPLGPSTLFAEVPMGGIGILDGMTADVCGNVYVVRMDGRIHRFLPDGSPAGVIDFSSHPGFQFVPAINFGSGFGGFERDRLYAMNFEGGLLEADVGIEGRWDPVYPEPE